MTLGELGRRITDVQLSVHGIIDKLDRDYVRSSTLDAALSAVQMMTKNEADTARDRTKDLDARVTALESMKEWAVRIVLGLVLVAVVGLVVKTGGTIK